jgi:hypothetical protein
LAVEEAAVVGAATELSVRRAADEQRLTDQPSE